MRLPRHCIIITVVCAVVLCLCLFLQFFWTETVYQNGRPLEAVRSVNADRVRTPSLGIVVLLSVEEITLVVKSLKRWSLGCSTTTLENVDLILYFARDLPAHEPELHFSSPCFSVTRMVSASIHAQVGRELCWHKSLSEVTPPYLIATRLVLW